MHIFKLTKSALWHLLFAYMLAGCIFTTSVCTFAEEIPYPAPPLDLEAEMKDNEDIQGLLYVPALQLAYPVVWKAFDNTYYMEHDLRHNESSYGCIMIDGWNTSDLTDCMTLVHGHNMADGTMFGSLKRFLDNEALAVQEPYIYYYYVEKEKVCVYRYQICSYYITDIYDKTYNQPELFTDYHGEAWKSLSRQAQAVLEALRNEWYDYMVYDMQERAIHTLPVPDLKDRPHLMMLSTCHGEVHGKTRLVVACFRI